MKPWQDLLAFLLPHDTERFEDWARAVVRGEHCHAYLWSVKQGNGKSLLMRSVGRAVGAGYLEAGFAQLKWRPFMDKYSYVLFDELNMTAARERQLLACIADKTRAFGASGNSEASGIPNSFHATEEMLPQDFYHVFGEWYDGCAYPLREYLLTEGVK